MHALKQYVTSLGCMLEDRPRGILEGAFESLYPNFTLILIQKIKETLVVVMWKGILIGVLKTCMACCAYLCLEHSRNEIINKKDYHRKSTKYL